MSEPALVRQIGIVSATALVVSNMIGTGIFTIPAYLASLGTPSLFVGIWVVGAFLALAGALCYSELGINFPRSGGEYVYLSEAWGPAWGFIDGWVSFIAGFSAAIAASALAISAYLGYFFPELTPETAEGARLSLGIFTVELGPPQLVACSIVILFTLLNVFGVSEVAKLQNLLTAGKLIVLAAFLVLGFAAGNGDWGNFSQPMERTSSEPLASQFAVSLIFVYFGYSGWNAAVYVAEELRQPERTLPIALVLGTILVAVLYAALNCLYVFANPLKDIDGKLAVGSTASASLFGGAWAGFFSAAMAASLLATVNAMSMIGPRVYYAMAKNKAFFPAAARVHPRWKSPWIAVLAQGICCCLLILTGTFRSLAYYVGFILSLFSALSVMALFKFRKRPEWKPMAWVSLGYPLIPALYVGVNIYIFVYFAVVQTREAVWALLTILGGAFIYHLYIRKQPQQG